MFDRMLWILTFQDVLGQALAEQSRPQGLHRRRWVAVPVCGGDEGDQGDVDQLKLPLSAPGASCRRPAACVPPYRGTLVKQATGLTTSKVSMLIKTHLPPFLRTSLPSLSATSCELPVSVAYRMSRWSMCCGSSSSSSVCADVVARGEPILKAGYMRDEIGRDDCG